MPSEAPEPVRECRPAARPGSAPAAWRRPRRCGASAGAKTASFIADHRHIDKPGRREHRRGDRPAEQQCERRQQARSRAAPTPPAATAASRIARAAAAWRRRGFRRRPAPARGCTSRGRSSDPSRSSPVSGTHKIFLRHQESHQPADQGLLFGAVLAPKGKAKGALAPGDSRPLLGLRQRCVGLRAGSRGCAI